MQTFLKLKGNTNFVKSLIFNNKYSFGGKFFKKSQY
jgi:hypothetical protein